MLSFKLFTFEIHTLKTMIGHGLKHSWNPAFGYNIKSDWSTQESQIYDSIVTWIFWFSQNILASLIMEIPRLGSKWLLVVSKNKNLSSSREMFGPRRIFKAMCCNIVLSSLNDSVKIIASVQWINMHMSACACLHPCLQMHKKLPKRYTLVWTEVFSGCSDYG